MDRLGRVASAAMSEGLTLFDTAERYGAKGTDLIPAACGPARNEKTVVTC